MKTIKIFPAVEELKNAAAEIFIEKAVESVQKRNRFITALSGGRSPLPVYGLLAEKDNSPKIPWEESIFFWSDERYVPLEDGNSNAGNALREFLNKVPVPPERIHTAYRKGTSAEIAAEDYESVIRAYFDGQRPHFDLIFLGCGEDAHTASLFPGGKALSEKERFVVAVNEKNTNFPRVTMTPLLINQARTIIFIAYGKNKASAVMNVLEGPRHTDKYPAQAIDAPDGEVYWLLDQAAASQLSKRN